MKKIICAICAVAVAAAALALGACSDSNATYTDPFFIAENWRYMTVNGGKTNDSGGMPYTLSDQSIKFHNANCAYDCGKDMANSEISFMLNGSSNWQMWFLADTVDNTQVNCYKLVYKDGILFFTTSETNILLPLVSAEATAAGYTENEWNKFELSFETAGSEFTAKLSINGSRVNFSSCEASPVARVKDGNFVHTRTENFTTGNYICVKVWYGDCFLRLKPVGVNTREPIKVACIGDSITFGANADNSYTDSYPAQLQKLLGGGYNVMNFGKSGATLRDSADDPYRKCDEYRGVKLFAPDISIIMLGSNDSKTYQKPSYTEIYGALESLIDELLSINYSMEIMLATSPYAYSGAYQINNANIEDIVVPAQKAVAEARLFKLIDMHEYTKDMNGNYADGVHPTSKGYAYIAYMMYCSMTDIQPDQTYTQSFKD